MEENPTSSERELWANVNGLRSRYEVSTSGRVRNKRTGKILSIGKNHKGYAMVWLYDGESRPKLVHRLVAEAFIPNPASKPQVNHKDGDILNNSVGNLERATASDNQRHRCAVLQKWDGYMHEPCRVVCEEDGKEFYSIRDASRKTNVSVHAISRSIHLHTEDCHGHHWEKVLL